MDDLKALLSVGGPILSAVLWIVAIVWLTQLYRRFQRLERRIEAIEHKNREQPLPR